MAKLPVEIIDLIQDGTLGLDVAVNEANRVQDEMQFLTLAESYSDAMRLNIFRETHTGTYFDALIEKKKEWRGYHPFLITFVDCELHSDEWSNLFSSRRAEKGMSIVTSGGVRDVIIPHHKLVAYFVYELAIHTLSFIVSGKKHHEEPLNCVFGFKQDKTRILDSMNAGALCDNCKRWFLENGANLSPAQLAAFDKLLGRSADLLQKPASEDAPEKPRVFVGSSVEGLEIARAIQSELQYDYSVEIWNQNTVFGLGTSTLEALEDAVNTYDYAVFVFTPDDQITQRDNNALVPRDNVIFEAGLFIGKLGRLRSFVVHPRNAGIQLPSDLSGLTTATYEPNAPVIDASVGPACRQIRYAIQRSES